MSISLKPQLILGYTEFFRDEVIPNRLTLIQDICITHLIAEIAGLNYRLKPVYALSHDSTLKTQIKELGYFCGGHQILIDEYSKIADNYTKSDEDFPLIFTRETCLFALEEIIQSDIKEIEKFQISEGDSWNNLLKYLLCVNTQITDIENSAEGELINFETLNPKLLVINELSLPTDPLNLPFRGFKLLNFFNNHETLNIHLNEYLMETYSLTFEKFIFELMSMYFANKQENEKFNFFYKVRKTDQKLFNCFSLKYSNVETNTLINIRKNPFFKLSNDEYFLTDNVLLLEKLYNQFINDFWFDYLKTIRDSKNILIYNIKQYKGIIGYFFEDYVANIIKYSFLKAKYYSIFLFEDLKISFKGQEIEIADLYLRHNSKIILGQVKSTTIYDKEKYAGNIDGLYKNNRDKFYETFGVDQLVNSITNIKDTLPQLDRKILNKNIRIYPLIIVSEKALQTPLMADNFQKRFIELLDGKISNKIQIYPLTIMHISDLENIQDYLNKSPNEIWNILNFHCKDEKFIPPLYSSIGAMGIKPNYNRTMKLHEDLLNKFKITQI